MGARNNAKYPWAKWFARSSFTVLRADYECAPAVMRQQVWNAAERHAPGRKVRARITGDGDIVVEVGDRSKRAARRYGGPPKKGAA